MKILLFSHTAAITGGAEQCLIEYVDVLVSQGHKCRVIVPYKGPMVDTLAGKKVERTVIGYGWATKPHRKVHPHRIMSSTGNSLVRIYQEVEKYKPDIIITNTAVIPWGLYAGKSFKIPTILLVHEILNEKDPSLRMVPSYKDYGEILNRHADYVIYNSLFVKKEFEQVLKLPKTSSSILYPLPPLDATKIDHFYKQNVIGAKLKIAIFGALSARKNQLEALQAAMLMRDAGFSDFRIDLYGDTTASPAYTKTLRKFIRENALTDLVKIKGFAPDVYKRMNTYNVILSTATYEPFGRTMIEGQLFGRIAITNNTGGGLELVENLKTGLIYETGRPEQLANKLQWVMDNPQKAMLLGERAKKEQLAKYITSSRYDALFEMTTYFSGRSKHSLHESIFDPTMCLFQYNHQLNNRYKNLYRLTHNRLTYPVKRLAARTLSLTKSAIRQII